MPKVSVIIPVYNGERYLRQCLSSVCAQTLRDIEILVVDDGSTDGTADILREYAQKDSRVRVLTQPNINAGAARNHGMRHATGEYYSFLDADDFFEPDMLERAVACADETGSDVVLYGYDLYLEEAGSFELPKKRRAEEALPAPGTVFAARDIPDLFSAAVGWPWDKLFRASYIRQLNLHFQEQRTTNDLLFVYAALARAGRVTRLERVLAHYRRTGRDSLSTTREKSWFCFYTALLALRAQLIEWELFDRYERDFVNYAAELSLWQLNTLAQPVKNVLVYMLGRAWLEQLGVTGRSESYFYDPETCRRLDELIKASETALSGPVAPDKARCLGDRLRGGLRCLREHGVVYTLRLALARLKKHR